MANDLSDLDHLTPVGSDLVSAGDDEIRETRTKLKNWATRDLSNTNAEHYNTGPHRFHVGDGTPPTYPGIPAVGNAGRIAIDSTNGYILRDNGSNWQICHAVTQWPAYEPSGVDLSVSIWNTGVTLSNVIFPPAAIGVVNWQLAWAPAVAGKKLQVRLLINGGGVTLPTIYRSVNSASADVGVGALQSHGGIFFLQAGPVAGSNTFVLQVGEDDTAFAGDASEILLRVLVI